MQCFNSLNILLSLKIISFEKGITLDYYFIVTIMYLRSIISEIFNVK